MTPQEKKEVEDLKKRVAELELFYRKYISRLVLEQDVEIKGNLLVKGTVRADNVV